MDRNWILKIFLNDGWAEFYSVLRLDYANIQEWYLDDILDLYVANIQASLEQKRWGLYLAMYPNFTKENYVSWEDFKPKKTAKTKLEDKNETINKVLKLRR